MQVSRNTLNKLTRCSNEGNCDERTRLYAERILEKLKACNSITIISTDERSITTDTHLEHFTELSGLRLIGPYLGKIKGLQHLSTHLKFLIITRCDLSLKKMLSQCLDDTLPLSWPCLLALKVSHCKLSSLDDSLKLLPILQELDLSFNKLVNPEQYLTVLDCLTHLNLSFNHLQRFPHLRSSVSWRLRVLNLSYNEITSLDGVNYLEGLTELNVSHNLLLSHSVLRVLRTLHNLKKICVKGNPMVHKKTHRIDTLRNVAPTALSPDFMLDDRKITSKELKILMYTPTAISVINSLYPSVNVADSNNYDVSMSSAVGVERRFPGGPIHKSTKKKSLTNRRRSPKPVSKQSQLSPKVEEASSTLQAQDEPQLTEDDITSTETSQEIFSAMESDADFERSYEEINKPATDDSFQTQDDSGMTESQQISTSENNSEGVTDYYSPAEEPSLYDTNNIFDGGNDLSGLQSDDESDIQTTQDTEQGTIVDDVLKDDEDVSAEITPQLHVRRHCIIGHIIGETALDSMSIEPAEFYIAITCKYLLERDIESGKVVEKLELSAVNEVMLDHANGTPILDVKFTYLQRDRRQRSYVILDRGANEAVNLLFRELQSVVFHNQSLNVRNYVCLKCSRTFVSEPPSAYGSALDSYAIQGGQFSPGAIYGLGASSLAQDKAVQQVVCSCGSDMVMETDRQQLKAKQSLFAIGEEAVKALDGEMAHSSSMHRASVPWVEGLSSMNEPAGGSNPLHVSGSLPSNLAGIVMNPVHSESKLQSIALSSPSVDVTSQSQAPFKTFSHLLTPHDLYKLVNVTPSASVLHSINPSMMSQLKQDSIHQNTFGSPKMERKMLREHMEQRVVTSTPRRKHPENTDVTGRDFSYKGVSNINASHDLKTSRALCFTKSYSTCGIQPVEYYPNDKNNSEFPTSLETNISGSLLHFIEDELLDPEEDLICVLQTSLSKSSGKNLMSYANSMRKSSKKKSLFTTPDGKGRSDKKATRKNVFIGQEIESLIILTTVNMHILKITSNAKDELTADVLECMAMHPLNQLSKPEVGLGDASLYFAVAGNIENKKTITSEQLNNVYSINIRSPAKCKRFYNVWNDVIFSGSTSDYQSDVSAAKTMSVQSLFSDALEKEFSEHILMYLDLNVLDGVGENQSFLLTQKLFVYYPCWILEGNEDVPTNLALSCGGSLVLFVEDHGLVLHEYSRAICQSASNKKSSSARERSSSMNSTSSQQNYSLLSPSIEQSPISATSENKLYKTASNRHFRDVINANLFEENHLTVELFFDKTPEEDAESWQVTFPCESSFKEFTGFILSYTFTLTGKNIEFQWK